MEKETQFSADDKQAAADQFVRGSWARGGSAKNFSARPRRKNARPEKTLNFHAVPVESARSLSSSGELARTESRTISVSFRESQLITRDSIWKPNCVVAKIRLEFCNFCKYAQQKFGISNINTYAGILLQTRLFQNCVPISI